MELLECKNLYKSYDEKQLLKNINLKIPKGKIIGLLGKNGTGKTTLIKLINDLLTPTTGEILINGLATETGHFHLRIRPTSDGAVVI